MASPKRDGFVQRQLWLPDDVDDELLELCRANQVPVGDGSRKERPRRTRDAHPGKLLPQLVKAALRSRRLLRKIGIRNPTPRRTP